MKNNQQPATNTEHPMMFEAPPHWALVVGCWLLNVSNS
jgi:hypothetical protein